MPPETPAAPEDPALPDAPALLDPPVPPLPPVPAVPPEPPVPGVATQPGPATKFCARLVLRLFRLTTVGVNVQGPDGWTEYEPGFTLKLYIPVAATDPSSHGCTTASCTKDLDCDCGYCVNGSCAGNLGFCSYPPQ